MNKIDPSCHEKLELMKSRLAADQKFEGQSNHKSILVTH